MALKEIVKERYSGFTSIEETLQSIAKQYQCSMVKASLILEEALSHKAWQGEPALYTSGELQPHLINSSKWFELRDALSKKRLDQPALDAYRKHLCRREEIATLLGGAGFPIDDVTPDGGQPRKGAKNTLHSENFQAGQASTYSAIESELAAANDEIERLSKQVPPYPGGLMKIAIDVQHRYWRGYDPQTGAGRPKQEIIRLEIMEEYGLSQTEANAVERVACPFPRVKPPC